MAAAVAKPDDRVLDIIAETLLAEPDRSAPPLVMRQLLERLRELLRHERARRPPHRPRGELGQMVETFIGCDIPQRKARRLTAQVSRKKITTVAQAHRRFRAQKALHK